MLENEIDTRRNMVVTEIIGPTDVTPPDPFFEVLHQVNQQLTQMLTTNPHLTLYPVFLPLDTPRRVIDEIITLGNASSKWGLVEFAKHEHSESPVIHFYKIGAPEITRR